MFDRIIALSVGNPVFVNLLFVFVIVAGAFSAMKLPREQFPEISLDRVAVSVAFPGATAQDVEELITKPLEEALDDVSDVERIQSLSSEGASLITITFLDGTDLQGARSEVEKAVATVENLPEDADTPVVRELKLELPVVSVALIGDTGAKHVVDRVSEKLRALGGVSTVSSSGLAERKLFVDLDERQLRALGLRPAQITSAIRRAHANVPAGTVERAGSDIFVKTENRLKSAEDVARIPIFPGSALRIGDIARVTDVADPADTRFWIDGHAAVKLTAGREETADPLRIREAVVALVDEMQAEMPPGIELRLADDYTAAIRDRLDTVAVNAISGGLLVLLVLLVMSGMRQALLALVGMPVSYLAAIFLMDKADLSINVVSTFGLLIATGIIVDDAVIVIENVQRHLEMGKSRRQATIDGTREVLLPVVVAVFTTCLAFIPLTMVSGTMGRVMRILPLVVIFCLLGSLLEALFILPGHLADFASTDAKESRTSRLVRRMRAVYSPFLRWCMRHRWLTLALTLASFAGTAALAASMPFQFGAPGKPYELSVHYEVMPGLDRATTKAQGDTIDALVRQHMGDRILTTSHRVGSILDQETGLTTTGANMGALRWEFAVDEETLAIYPGMVRELRLALATNPELARHAVKEVQAGPPAGAAITARLRGRDIDELNRGLSDLKTALYGMAGVTDIRDNYGSGKETFRVVVDQDRAALHGLTEMDVAEAVRGAWASLWNPRAVSYRKRVGLDTTAIGIAVVVQRMVDAERSGVLFTANPLDHRRDRMLLSASWGLGEAVVGGDVSPDNWVMDRSGKVLSHHLSDKQVITLREGKGTVNRPMPEDMRRAVSLSDAEVAELARLGARAQAYFGTPQDLEARSRYHQAVTVALEQPVDAAALNGLPGVLAVESQLDGRQLTVLAQPGAVIFPAVGELAQSRGWPVRELSVERGRLDDVFRSLTSGEAA